MINSNNNPSIYFFDWNGDGQFNTPERWRPEFKSRRPHYTFIPTMT